MEIVCPACGKTSTVDPPPSPGVTELPCPHCNQAVPHFPTEDSAELPDIFDTLPDPIPVEPNLDATVIKPSIAPGPHTSEEEADHDDTIDIELSTTGAGPSIEPPAQDPLSVSDDDPLFGDIAGEAENAAGDAWSDSTSSTTPEPMFGEDSALQKELHDSLDFLEPSSLGSIELEPSSPPPDNQAGSTETGLNLDDSGNITLMDALGTSEAKDESPADEMFVPSLMDEPSLELDRSQTDTAIPPAPPGSLGRVELGTDAPRTTGIATGATDESRAPQRFTFSSITLGISLAAAIAIAFMTIDFSFLLEPDSAPPPLPPLSTKHRAPPKSEPEAVPTKSPPPETQPEIVLRADTVNNLTYDELKQALANRTDSTTALSEWALFRLAAIYGDDTAAQRLEQDHRPPKRRAGPLAIAAHVGALAVSDKARQAIKFGNRAWKKRKQRSAELAFAIATVAGTIGKQRQAERMLNYAMMKQPKFIDAQLLQAKLWLTTKKRNKALTRLTATPDNEQPETALRRSSILLEAKAYSSLRKLQSILPQDMPPNTIPPSLQAGFAIMQTQRSILTGELSVAITNHQARLETMPNDAMTVIGLARLQQAAGDDGAALVSEHRNKVTKPVLKSRLLAAEVALLIDAGKIDEAQGLLKNAEVGKKNKQARRWLSIAQGDVAIATGEKEKAKKRYQAALTRSKPIPQAAVGLVHAQNPPGQRDLAKLTTIARQTRSAFAKAALASEMLSRENARGAVTLFEDLLWSGIEDVDPNKVARQYVQALSQAGQPKDAQAIGELMAAQRPEDMDVVQMMLRIAQQANNQDEQIRWLRVRNTHQPHKLDTVVPLIQVLVAQNQKEEARRIIEAFIREKPDVRSPQLQRLLAEIWIGDDDVKARSILKQSAALHPEAETLTLLGKLEERRNNPNEAINYYTEALKLKPIQPKARRHLAKLLIESDRLADAIKHLQELTTTAPGDMVAWELLGDTLTDLGQPDKALNAYRSALRRAGGDETLMMKVAQLQLYTLNQSRGALRILKRIVQKNPKHAEAHFRLGIAHKDQDQQAQAEKAFRRYLKLAPDGEFAEEVLSELQSMNPE